MNNIDHLIPSKLEVVLRCVADTFGASVSDIISERRHRSVVRPRQIAMYLANKLVTTSLLDIGRAVGGRDQVSVSMAVASIEPAIESEMALRRQVEELSDTLSTHFDRSKSERR